MVKALMIPNVSRNGVLVADLSIIIQRLAAGCGAGLLE